MRRFYYAILLTFTLIILSSCGRGVDYYGYEELDEEFEEWLRISSVDMEILQRRYSGDTVSLPYFSFPDDPARIVTLRVHAEERHITILQQAELMMNLSRAAVGNEIAVRVEVDRYNVFHYEEAFARLGVELMAGRGPDLLLACRAPVWDWVRSGFFTDINDLIAACPTFQRADFYENVLDAMEYRGALYAFPLSFGFEFVAINNSLPQHTLNRFSEFEYISVGGLMEIYADLMSVYGGQFGHLDIGNHGRILTLFSHLVPYAVGTFIDFENRIADLTNYLFVDFLYQLQRVFTLEDMRSTNTMSIIPFADVMLMHGLSMEQVFFVASERLTPINAFFPLPPRHQFFSYFIPMVCEGGRLRVDYTYQGPTWDNVLFPSVGNSALAWEFSQYLLEAMSNPILRAYAVRGRWGEMSFATPIRRDLFEPRLRPILEYHVFSHPHLNYGMDEAAKNAAIDATIARMAELNERPVTVPPPLPPGAINLDAIEQLLSGIIAPAEAAQRLQNQITLWFMEIG